MANVHAPLVRMTVLIIAVTASQMLCECPCHEYFTVQNKKRAERLSPALSFQVSQRSTGLWKALTYTFPHHKH
jgi:hypothetical protein